MVVALKSPLLPKAAVILINQVICHHQICHGMYHHLNHPIHLQIHHNIHHHHLHPYPISQHVSPSAPYYPITHQPSHMPPSALLNPENNDPAEPPSYESAIAANYTVPQPAPSGEPVEESKTAQVP